MNGIESSAAYASALQVGQTRSDFLVGAQKRQAASDSQPVQLLQAGGTGGGSGGGTVTPTRGRNLNIVV